MNKRQRRSLTGSNSILSNGGYNDSKSQKASTKKIEDLQQKLIQDLIQPFQDRPLCPGEAIKQALKESKERINDLNEINSEYFDHMAGRCICARCTCGRHRCQHRGLVQDGSAIPISLYNDSFLGQKPMAREKLIKHSNNLQIKKDQKMEQTTTHRHHYTPKQSEPRPPSEKKQDNIRITSLPGQLETETSYKKVHNYKEYSKPVMVIPNPNITIMHDSPFKGKSEMRSQYNPEILAHFAPINKGDIITKSCGVNMGVDQSKSPNFYKTTYSKEYTPLSKADNEKEFLNSLKKINQSLHTFQDKGLFIPQSTQKVSYQDNTNQVCPIYVERTRIQSAHSRIENKLNQSLIF